LDAAGALGLVLHHMSSMLADIRHCKIFALIHTSDVHQYITLALPLLLQTLQKIPEAQVYYPCEMEFEELSALIATHNPQLTGAFGSMDGINLLINTFLCISLSHLTACLMVRRMKHVTIGSKHKCMWSYQYMQKHSSSKNCSNVLRFWTVLAVALWDHGIVLCNKYILYHSM
jgi:hypothetical protein